MATGGSVKTWRGGWDAPVKKWDAAGNAVARRKAAWEGSLSNAENAWWQGTVDAYRARGALPNADNMRLIEKMTQVLFKPLGK